MSSRTSRTDWCWAWPRGPRPLFHVRDGKVINDANIVGSARVQRHRAPGGQCALATEAVRALGGADGMATQVPAGGLVGGRFDAPRRSS